MRVQYNPVKKGPRIEGYEGLTLEYEYKSIPSSLKEFAVANSPEKVVQLFEKLGLLDDSRERMYSFYINNNHAIVAYRLVGAGDDSHLCSHDKLSLGPAITLNLPNFIVVHNHPAGTNEPSDADIRFAVRIEAEAFLLGLNLVDCIIVSKNRETDTSQYYSFREKDVFNTARKSLNVKSLGAL